MRQNTLHYGFKVLSCFLVWNFATSVTPRQPIGSSMVADWVKEKCGTSGQQLWKYHGSLYDPLDGRKVASVEGLEWVMLLRQNETADRPIYAQVLNHPNATWKYAASIWSKHLFCYTIGEGDNGNTKLLQSIRIRPYSPEKSVPLDQAAAAYETTSTLIESTDGQIFLHSEWPSPRHENQTISLWGSASANRDSKDGSLGFSVYCKRRSPKSPLFLPDLSQRKEDDERNAADGHNSTITVSPKRLKWVQFGMSNMETNHKFGARETYSITGKSSNGQSFHRRRKTRRFRLPWVSSPIDMLESPKLAYSRYGEGPPFYAPGRMCMLELQAEPIDDLQQASPIVQRLLRESVQGWESPRGGSPFQLRPSEISQDAITTCKGYVIKAWEKARSVSNIVSFFRKEKGYWTGS